MVIAVANAAAARVICERCTAAATIGQPKGCWIKHFI